MSVHREKVSKDKQGFIEKGKGVRKGEGLGLKPPLELDILQKLYYLRKGHLLFSHTFCLLICRLIANTIE